MATKLGRVMTYLDDSFPCRHVALKSHGLARSLDQLNSLCLHYCNAYGHQTWQDGDLP